MLFEGGLGWPFSCFALSWRAFGVHFSDLEVWIVSDFGVEYRCSGVWYLHWTFPHCKLNYNAIFASMLIQDVILLHRIWHIFGPCIKILGYGRQNIVTARGTFTIAVVSSNPSDLAWIGLCPVNKYPHRLIGWRQPKYGYVGPLIKAHRSLN